MFASCYLQEGIVLLVWFRLGLPRINALLNKISLLAHHCYGATLMQRCTLFDTTLGNAGFI
jgi:hypothetical protein